MSKSIAPEVFVRCGLGGIISDLYCYFPEHLQDLIVQKHAQLYKELYNLLSPEEKQEVNDSFYDESRSVEEKLESVRSSFEEEIKRLIDFYSQDEFKEENIRLTHSSMPESFIQERIKYPTSQIDGAKNKLLEIENSIIEAKNAIQQKEIQAEYFRD